MDVRRCTAAAGILVLLGASPAAGQDQGMGILQEVGRRYASISSLCADFTQRLSVPLLRAERAGAGHLCQARPNLFAMRFSDPEGDLVVVDGESTWVYFPSNDPKQVLRTPVDRNTGGRDFHREFLEDPEVKYDVTYEATEDVAGTATHRLRLVPKAPTTYRSAVLWIEQRAPVLRQIRIEEENGNRRTISLSDIAFDVTPPAGWFDFTPPPGVLVIPVRGRIR